MNVDRLNRRLRDVVSALEAQPRRVLHVPARMEAYAVPIFEILDSTATISILKDYELIYINPQPAGIRAGYGPRSRVLVVADREEEE